MTQDTLKECGDPNSIANFNEILYSEDIMIYDLIIVGAGAAGLFAAANAPYGFETLVLEKTDSPGKKLLLTGSGQCNLTNNEPIKSFLNRYGENGKYLRPVLFPFSNQALMAFFEQHGLPLVTREDGKVFPVSMKSRDVLNFLLKGCEDRGVELQYRTAVTKIEYQCEGVDYKYCILTSEDPESAIVQANSKYSNSRNLISEHANSSGSSKQYFSKRILIATGGESYPQTGSDGSIYKCLENLGITLVPRQPALTPIYVENYPYSALSGLTFPNSSITINSLLTTDSFKAKNSSTAANGIAKKSNESYKCNGSLLFTHKGFSGPPILTLSRYVKPGDKLTINYLQDRVADELRLELIKSASGDLRQIITILESITALPRSFLECICYNSNINKSEKASSLSGKQMGALASRLTSDSYVVSGIGDFSLAMTTAGGVALDEVDLRTMEAKHYPGLYFAGEVLDVDGDTGGYNLQFAFSSAMRCVEAM